LNRTVGDRNGRPGLALENRDKKENPFAFPLPPSSSSPSPARHPSRSFKKDGQLFLLGRVAAGDRRWARRPHRFAEAPGRGSVPLAGNFKGEKFGGASLLAVILREPSKIDPHQAANAKPASSAWLLAFGGGYGADDADRRRCRRPLSAANPPRLPPSADLPGRHRWPQSPAPVHAISLLPPSSPTPRPPPPPQAKPEKVDAAGLEVAIAERTGPLVVDFYATWQGGGGGAVWPRSIAARARCRIWGSVRWRRLGGGGRDCHRQSAAVSDRLSRLSATIGATVGGGRQLPSPSPAEAAAAEAVGAPRRRGTRRRPTLPPYPLHPPGADPAWCWPRNSRRWLSSWETR